MDTARVNYFTIFFRMVGNFKLEKFAWDQAFSWSLRKRNAEKCKNF